MHGEVHCTQDEQFLSRTGPRAMIHERAEVGDGGGFAQHGLVAPELPDGVVQDVVGVSGCVDVCSTRAGQQHRVSVASADDVIDQFAVGPGVSTAGSIESRGTDLRERVCPELLGVQQRAEGLAHALFRCSRPWNWATARFIISRARDRSPA